MRISFYGGAGWVTGSNYLLEHEGKKILIDCGLFQGTKYADDLNYEPLKYNAKEVDFLFATHSHIDHVGRMPKLYRDGFRGKLITTTATRDLMEVALPDNLTHIAKEAEEAGREPLYSEKDIVGLLSLAHGIEYDQQFDLGNGVYATLHDAGHILGSAIVEIKWDVQNGPPKKIFFSGDMGNPPTPLLNPTEFIHDATYIVIESAYGDRVHEDRSERQQKLAEVIVSTAKRNGVLMIPSFSLERTQELLSELNDLHEQKKIPDLPIFVDSPLAIKMTRVYQRHKEYFNKVSRQKIAGGDDILSFHNLKLTENVEDSKKINDIPLPKVIIAGSGMSQGGRILHHEQRYLPDPNSTILIVGYQVKGSRGRKIMKGEKEVTIFGERVPIRCHVQTLHSYSAHADQPTLLAWLEEANSKKHLQKVFVVQGEEQVENIFAQLVREHVGVETFVPVPNQSFDL